jgi:hypothetical protein
MKTFLICFFLYITLSAEAQFEKAVKLDEHKGLIGSDIKLGMKMKDIPDLVEVPHSITGKRLSWYETTEGIITWYKRKNEKLDLAGVKFESIYYRFEKNKLIEIYANFDLYDRSIVVTKFSEIYGLYSEIPIYPKYDIQWTVSGWRGKKILLIESVSNLIILQEKKKENKKEYFNWRKKRIEYEAEGSFEFSSLSSLTEKEKKKELKERIKYSNEEFDVKVYYFKKEWEDYKSSKYVKKYMF